MRQRKLHRVRIMVIRGGASFNVRFWLIADSLTYLFNVRFRVVVSTDRRNTLS
ncbi:MAG: hypothetical protein HOF23_05845 [Rhodospirillaceae bacterium]|nr:hypothetical protein [Rhodospirillaceae bacterium]